jgi:hypothetical protein
VHPILLLILVIAVLLAVSWVKRLPPASRKSAGFKMALVAAGALLLLALVTGRLNPLIALVAASIPMLQRVLSAKSLFDRMRSASGPSKGQTSNLSTRFLDMTLDHDSGEMSGRVREGRFSGRSLAGLDVTELLVLLEEFRATDAQSAAVLEAYLDRQHGADWREQTASAASTSDAMTENEARQILGVSADAKAEEIVSAHRRLMQRMHPDRGGSGYLAAKINQAKDLLLDHT